MPKPNLITIKNNKSMACEYFIGDKKYTEQEFKDFLLKEGLDSFIESKAIELSKDVLPAESCCRALVILACSLYLNWSDYGGLFSHCVNSTENHNRTRA
jgi:hypothetical protein